MAKKTTTAKKPTGPDVLLARFTPVPKAFAGLEASYLPFPYYSAVQNFQRAVGRPGEPRTLPLRRLNNLLLACLPTLTHGFEYSSSGHRMLAVGTPGVPLAVPEPRQVHQLVLAWASHWARPYLTEKPQACLQLMDALERMPLPAWQRLSPLQLVQNSDEAGNIIYAAIPALLATLLHGQQLTINEGRQTLSLRKVQGDASNQAGLYVVSRPFRGHYLQVDRATGEAQPKEGYFAYRIDFKVETQAGRFYENSQHLRPWIFLRISCQRYGHRPLSKDNFGRDLSVLTSSNHPRLPHAKTDGTLVRLQAGTRRGEVEYQWLDELPELLEEAQARALVPAEEVLRQQPGAYGVEGDTQDAQGDEYYVVHAEGYKYEKKNHSIKTGFHFDEHRDLLNQLLAVLNGVLLPDSPLPADVPLPTGVALPAALKPFKSVRGTALRQQSAPPAPVAPAKARRAAKPSMQAQLHSRLSETMLGLASGQQAQLLLVYREKSTRASMVQQVRRTLLLAADEDFPAWLAIKEVLITDATLLDHHEKCAKQAKRPERKAHYRRQHELKREAWKTLLGPHRLTTARSAFAFIEIGEPTVDEPRKIRGAVREACARLGISSQMLHTAKYAKRKGELTTEFGWDVQSRVANAALDLLIRQPGVLAGPPSEAYARKKAGLPEALATSLDVVALYRHQHRDSGLHYALAVRLRATGAVEVLFPQEQKWLPYADAGPHLGNFFADRRREHGAVNGQVIGLEMSATQLGQFAARVVTTPHERPTLILIEADVWRNEGANKKTWGQLKNHHLAAQRDCLDFTHLHGQGGYYDRNDEALTNLLGVVRLRMNHETPQYLPAVPAAQSAQDFKPLSGFIDRSIPEVWHYFSVGRAATTQKTSGKTAERGLFKMDAGTDDIGNSTYGAGTAFRHQQVVEMVPFFVKPELQHEEGILALCRIPHYLRNSPAWSTANTLLPFPMHLAKCLIEDYICVLGS